MTRGIRLTGFFALALLAALVIFLSAEDTRAAPPPFEPGGVVCFENMESPDECDGDTAPNATPDIRSKFCIGWNDNCSVRDDPVTDSNFGGVVGFTPAEWTLPKGDTIPIGAIGGRLESEAWLGLLNGACNSRVNTVFTMLNASINISDQIEPRPEGATDVFQPLAQDVQPANGIPDGADRYPSYLAEFFTIDGTVIQPRARLFGITNIQQNWVALNFVFFEPGQTIEVAETRIAFNPALGYPSITILNDPTAQTAPQAITDFCAPLFSANINLGKTINNPCTPRVTGANCPVTADEAPEFQSSNGEPYPSFPCDQRSKIDDDGDGKINDGCPVKAQIAETGAQCDNETSDDGEDSDVNDGCPAVGDSEGARIPGACSGTDEGGCTYRMNPAAGGTFTFVTMALSQRDADGDGYENGLDVCFDKPNSEWNPRIAPQDEANDSDKDGLPNACDPDSTTPSESSPNGCKSGYVGEDEDQDCFANRADNCPTTPSLQDPNKAPNNFPGAPDQNPPLAPDEDSDGIGDACDPDKSAPNGEYIGYCMRFALNVGGAGGAVTGVRDAITAPDCAAQGPVIQQPTGTGIQPTTRATTNTSGNTNTGGGVGGPPSGVGSLSPAATDFPVWAAILAGIGAAGVVSGLALYARLAPRKQR